MKRMMKKLIITAHPNPNGFTHHIAQTFIETSEEKGNECFLMNLYDPEWKQDYLQLGENNKPLPDPKQHTIQETISWADELVFIFPLWRFDCPAIMKTWREINMSSGFAYAYQKGSIFPKKFLHGKGVRVFFTGGSPDWVLGTLGLALLSMWRISRINYVGMSLRSRTFFGKVPTKRTKEEREKMLATVRKIAKR